MYLNRIRVVTTTKFLASCVVHRKGFGSLPKFPSSSSPSLLLTSAAVGVAVGGVGATVWKLYKTTEKTTPTTPFSFLIAACAPAINPPQAALLNALRILHTPPQDPVEKQRHDFKWTCTIDAVGIQSGSTPGGAYAQAKAKTFQEWDLIAHQLFGKQDWEKVKVQHVILKTVDEIENELTHTVGNQFVSRDHQDWVWLPRKQEMVTFIRDKPGYRVYCYEAFVAVEIKMDKHGNHVPISIRFISENPFPKNAAVDDVYVKTIVENFSSDFDRFADKVIYVN